LKEEIFEYFTKVRPFRAPTTISNFLIEPHRHQSSRIVGVGGSGTVGLETDRASGREFAVKRFYPCDSERITFLREIEALVRLNHPCILPILGYSFPTSSTSAEIHTKYAENGSLHTLVKRVHFGQIPSFWNPTGIGIIICEIVFGMRFVHANGFVHLDLKPSNILINSLGHALIGDFGTSRLEIDDSRLTTDTATVNYAAPEMFEEGDSTNKADVFSFGLVLYEILIGSAVFPSSRKDMEVMGCILAGDMPEIPAKCGQFMQNLISRCWSPNPEDRPSFDEILEEFRKCDFAIVPDADPGELRPRAWGIIAWEDGNSRVQKAILSMSRARTE
jgi:serine/threonine-protein kinase CTR1